MIKYGDRMRHETTDSGKREDVRGRNVEEDIIFEVDMVNENDLKPFFGYQQWHFGV